MPLRKKKRVLLMFPIKPVKCQKWHEAASACEDSTSCLSQRKFRQVSDLEPSKVYAEQHKTKAKHVRSWSLLKMLTFTSISEQFGKVHKIWAQVSGLHFTQAVRRDTDSQFSACFKTSSCQTKPEGWMKLRATSSYSGKTCAKQARFPALLQLQQTNVRSV